MKKPDRLFNRSTTPDRLTSKDGITFWQEKVLRNLLFLTVIFGFITYVPAVVLSIKENLWIIAFIDTFMYLCILFLFFRTDLPYRFRAASIPLISYILGMVLFITLGPFGAGPVWLFFFPVITGVLLGRKPGFYALALVALTLMGSGALIYFHVADAFSALNVKTWNLTVENPLEKWGVICLNFMLLNIGATLSVTSVLNGLQKSLADLAASEKKHRQIFENIPDIYFETSMDGIILEVSPSVDRLSEYTQAEIKGQSFLTIYKNPDQQKEIIAKLLRNGNVKNHDLLLVNRNGKVHFCSLNAELTKDKSGKPEKIVGVIRDVSELKAMAKDKKELEERLNRSRKMEALGLLAGGVAHDLNNILSGIVTYPEILAMNLNPGDPMKKSLEIIHTSGKKASEIVQDLLTLSRRGVITTETLDLNRLITNFLVTPEAKKIFSFHPNVRIEKHLDAQIPFMKGSFVHLQKTLMNLILNAAEAQPDGGTIYIHTQNQKLATPLKGYDQVDPGTYLVLRTKDTGFGIDPEDLKRIFEPFFTKKVMGRSGTGLGMAVVWGTVQDHGGYIDIVSSPGNGTTIDLYFPISTDDVPVNPMPFSLDAFKGSGEKILIIDDVAEQRFIAQAALERLGYQTACAGSGEEAIAFLKEHTVDLLLLDMIMSPDMDGFETYRQILSFRPGQKAVIASGFSQTHPVKKALALGAGAYLKKPYSVEGLGAAIKEALKKSH